MGYISRFFPIFLTKDPLLRGLIDIREFGKYPNSTHGIMDQATHLDISSVKSPLYNVYLKM